MPDGNAPIDGKQFIEDTNRALNELRTITTKHGDDIKSIGPLERDQYEKLQKTLDNLQDRSTKLEDDRKVEIEARKSAEEKAADEVAKREALEAKVGDLEAAIKTPGGDDPKESKEDAEYKSAYGRFLRKDHITPEDRALFDSMKEAKSLTISGDGSNAGHLAPEEYREQIIEKLSETSPIRSVATVITTGRQYVEIPVETGHADPVIIAEEASVNDDSDEMTFRMQKITPVALTSKVQITDEMLEDSVFDLEAFLNDRWTKRFAKVEGANFIQGTGAAGTINGLANTQTNTSIDAAVTLTDASGATGNAQEKRTARTFLANDLLKLIHDVPSSYARNGTWAFHRDTLRRIRTLRTGANGDGDFVFQPGFSGTTGAPNTVFGHTYIECPDMPMLGTSDVAAQAKVIYFGDFSEYWIVDRTALRVLRDPYTGGGNRRIRFIASRRVGGSVMIKDAFRALSVGA